VSLQRAAVVAVGIIGMDLRKERFGDPFLLVSLEVDQLLRGDVDEFL
jgi:hypothetical protein